MQSQEIVVAKLIEQLQTYQEDLRAGRPMSRTAALQLGELIPDLRTAVAERRSRHRHPPRRRARLGVTPSLPTSPTVSYGWGLWLAQACALAVAASQIGMRPSPTAAAQSAGTIGGAGGFPPCRSVGGHGCAEVWLRPRLGPGVRSWSSLGGRVGAMPSSPWRGFSWCSRNLDRLPLRCLAPSLLPVH